MDSRFSSNKKRTAHEALNDVKDVDLKQRITNLITSIDIALNQRRVVNVANEPSVTMTEPTNASQIQQFQTAETAETKRNDESIPIPTLSSPTNSAKTENTQSSAESRNSMFDEIKIIDEPMTELEKKIDSLKREMRQNERHKQYYTRAGNKEKAKEYEIVMNEIYNKLNKLRHENDMSKMKHEKIEIINPNTTNYHINGTNNSTDGINNEMVNHGSLMSLHNHNNNNNRNEQNEENQQEHQHYRNVNATAVDSNDLSMITSLLNHNNIHMNDMALHSLEDIPEDDTLDDSNDDDDDDEDDDDNEEKENNNIDFRIEINGVNNYNTFTSVTSTIPPNILKVDLYDNDINGDNGKTNANNTNKNENNNNIVEDESESENESENDSVIEYSSENEGSVVFHDSDSEEEDDDSGNENESESEEGSVVYHESDSNSDDDYDSVVENDSESENESKDENGNNLPKRDSYSLSFTSSRSTSGSGHSSSDTSGDNDNDHEAHENDKTKIMSHLIGDLFENSNNKGGKYDFIDENELRMLEFEHGKEVNQFYSSYDDNEDDNDDSTHVANRSSSNESTEYDSENNDNDDDSVNGTTTTNNNNNNNNNVDVDNEIDSLKREKMKEMLNETARSAIDRSRQSKLNQILLKKENATGNGILSLRQQRRAALSRAQKWKK